MFCEATTTTQPLLFEEYVRKDINQLSEVLKESKVNNKYVDKPLYQCLSDVLKSSSKHAPKKQISELPKDAIFRDFGSGGETNLDNCKELEKLQLKKDENERNSMPKLIELNQHFDELTNDRKLGGAIFGEEDVDAYCEEIKDPKEEMRDYYKYNVKHKSETLSFPIHKTCKSEWANRLFKVISFLNIFGLFRSTKNSYHPTVPGLRVNVEFKKDAALPFFKPTKVAGEHQEQFYNLIQQASTQGVFKEVKESNVKYSIPVFSVPKKNGDRRLILDFKRMQRGASINTAIKMNNVSYPTIKEIVESVSKFKYVTTADVSNCFWSFQLTEQSSYKFTACLPTMDHLGPDKQLPSCVRITRIPMGCKISTVVVTAFFSLFRDSLYKRLRPHNKSVFKFYIDDTFLCSNSVSEHLEALAEYFKLADSMNLKLPPEKIRLFSSGSFNCLGFKIKNGGIELDSSYRDTIKKFTPENITTKRAYQALMGIVCWVSQSNPKILVSFANMTHICKKGEPGKADKIVWDREAVEALEQVKKQVSFSMPRHRIDVEPSPKGPFGACLVIQTDSSMRCGGYTVHQCQQNKKHGKSDEPLVLVDFGVKIYPQSWSGKSISEKESIMVVFVLQKLKAFLLSDRFAVIIRTDNSTLLHILRGSIRSTLHAACLNLLADRARWCYWDHVTDKNMGIPDGLSRLFEEKPYEIPKQMPFLQFLEKRFEHLEKSGEMVRFPDRQAGTRGKKQVRGQINRIIMSNCQTYTGLKSYYQNLSTINFVSNNGQNKYYASIMRNICYKSNTAKKGKKTLDEIRESQLEYDLERQKSNKTLMECLTKSVKFTEDDEVIENVENYEREKEMTNINDELGIGNKNSDEIVIIDEDNEKVIEIDDDELDDDKAEKIIENVNPTSETSTQIHSSSKKRNHWQENYDSFTKSSKEFSEHRKSGEKLNSADEKFLVEAARMPLLKMHTQNKLHRSTNECKEMFDLNNQECEALDELIKSCALCKRFKYEHRDSAKPITTPSSWIPATPLCVFSGDIFQMPESKVKGRNQVYNYFLAITDITSGFIFSAPIESKAASDVKVALGSFIQSIGCAGGLLCFDQDSTIQSKEIISFLKSHRFNTRLMEKGGNTIAEVAGGLAIKRRLAVAENDWPTAMVAVVAELNVKRRPGRLNFSPYNLVFSKAIDMDFYRGTLRSQYPQLTNISVDFQRLQKHSMDLRLYRFNKHGLRIGDKVSVRSKDVWDLSRQYVVREMDERGLYLELFSIDEKRVSKAEATRYSLNRSWKDVRRS